jgi:hypothetical protein
VTTAIIGTGGLGSVIGRQLTSGGETLRLSSADIHACFRHRRQRPHRICRRARTDQGRAPGHRPGPLRGLCRRREGDRRRDARRPGSCLAGSRSTRVCSPTSTKTTTSLLAEVGPGARPGALRDLVKEQLRKFPGAAFTPHQIGKVLERSAGAADHGRAMIAGPHRARHPSVGAGRRRLGRPVLPRREAFPANSCLPALDARPPERLDHIVGG